MIFPKWRVRCGFCRGLINPPKVDALALHLLALNKLSWSMWEQHPAVYKRPLINFLSGLEPQWYREVPERRLHATLYRYNKKIEPERPTRAREPLACPPPLLKSPHFRLTGDPLLETQTWLTKKEKEQLPYLREILGEFVKGAERQGHFEKGKAIKRSPTRCAVCLHNDRDIIESRILSGDPLHYDGGDGESGILKDYPLPLFYHQKVCLGKHRWKEFFRRTDSDNSNRWPVKLRNFWIIKLAEQYGHFNNVRLGVSRFRRHFVNWGDGFEYEGSTPIIDPSVCLDCTCICKRIDKLDDPKLGLNAIFNDSIPGLREVIHQRNERHPLYSSGDSAVGKGRIPNKLVRKTCIIGRKQIHRIARMLYLKQFPAYSESSDEEFREHIAKKMRLTEEDLKFDDYYKTNSLKDKYRDYYKFPIFYTSGRPFDADKMPIPLMEHINKWENFHRLVSFCCQPEEVSSWRISEKRTRTFPDPVYLPKKGKDARDRGVKERDEFAIIYRDDWADLKRRGFIEYFKKYFKLTPQIKNKIRWALARGSVGSYHNERMQAVRSCFCGGTIRYDEHLALICDRCSTFYGYKIFAGDLRPYEKGEEESGDSNFWKVNELDAEGDEDPHTQLGYDGVNHRSIGRLNKNLEKERREKEEEEKRKIEYIESDSRKTKSAFLDYKISMLLKQNREGLEQRSLKDLLREQFKNKYYNYHTDVTDSTIKTAIARMETRGLIKTTDMYTKGGKRIFVRLIAKT